VTRRHRHQNVVSSQVAFLVLRRTLALKASVVAHCGVVRRWLDVARREMDVRGLGGGFVRSFCEKAAAGGLLC